MDDIGGGLAAILAVFIVAYILAVVAAGVSVLLILGAVVHMLVWLLANLPNWRRIDERWIWLVAALFVLVPIGMFWAMVWHPIVLNENDYYNLGIMGSWGSLFLYPVWLTGYIASFFVKQIERGRFSFNFVNARGMAGTVMDSMVITMRVRWLMWWQNFKIRRLVSR